MPDTFPCPNCGEDVPQNALACPHCGSDEETGWSEDTAYDDIDLPALDEDFEDPANMPAKQKVYLITAAVMLIVILLLVLAGVW